VYTGDVNASKKNSPFNKNKQKATSSYNIFANFMSYWCLH